MVKGLDIFRAGFQDFAGQYILIGGAACEIAMAAAGLAFRTTKDLDIVLCVEVLDVAFGRAFWRFIEDGGYARRERSAGQRQFYRFEKPRNPNYPYMLELFSRRPGGLPTDEKGHLTTLPMEEDVSSLSAILMDTEYYKFICDGRQIVDGVSMVGARQLIALKARAWLDLTARADNGERVDSRVLKKHKNDVFRLFQILDPAADPAAPGGVKHDLENFLTRMRDEEVDLNALGIRTGTRDGVLAEIARIYGLGWPTGTI